MRTIVAGAMLLLTGCSASGATGGATSGSGGDAVSVSGTGGGGGHGEGGQGGVAGAGGQPPDGESVETGVDQAASLGYVARELACAGSTLYWFNETARRLMRLSDDGELEAFAVNGEGEVMVRSAGEHVMVSLLGDSGAVWLVGDDDPELAWDGPVRYAAFGDSLPHWYDGESIRTPDGAAATPDGHVVAFGVYDEGPVFLTGDNSIYLVKRGQAARIGEAPAGYYPNTFTVAGATAAWGSPQGMRVMPLSGSALFAFGADVRAVTNGPSGLFMCERRDSGDRIAHLESSGKLVTVANHKTCVSLVECRGKVYWSTEPGNIFAVAVGARGTN